VLGGRRVRGRGWHGPWPFAGADEVVVGVLGLDLAVSWRTNLMGGRPSPLNANGGLPGGTVMGFGSPFCTGERW
jgi:hypothetical protein